MVMTKDDILKLKAATLYVLKKCGEADYIHLFKILYFAERKHYAEYGHHLIRDTFCALGMGPVPSFLYDAVKVAVKRHKPNDNLNIIANALVPCSGEADYILSAKEEPDMDELSKADIAALDWSINENKDKDYRQLSKESHDAAWKEAWDYRQASPMNPYSIAKAGGANDGFIAYMKESDNIDKLLKSDYE